MLILEQMEEINAAKANILRNDQRVHKLIIGWANKNQTKRGLKINSFRLWRNFIFYSENLEVQYFKLNSIYSLLYISMSYQFFKANIVIVFIFIHNSLLIVIQYICNKFIEWCFSFYYHINNCKLHYYIFSPVGDMVILFE